jgi:hypothetical protein
LPDPDSGAAAPAAPAPGISTIILKQHRNWQQQEEFRDGKHR